MSITQLEILKNPCQVCKRKESTRLCDKVIGEFRYAGHPPRTQMAKGNYEMSRVVTCDRPLCDDCAIHINTEVEVRQMLGEFEAKSTCQTKDQVAKHLETAKTMLPHMNGERFNVSIVIKQSRAVKKRSESYEITKA